MTVPQTASLVNMKLIKEQLEKERVKLQGSTMGQAAGGPQGSAPAALPAQPTMLSDHQLLVCIREWSLYRGGDCC